MSVALPRVKSEACFLIQEEGDVGYVSLLDTDDFKPYEMVHQFQNLLPTDSVIVVRAFEKEQLKRTVDLESS